MIEASAERLLAIETSGRVGQVALAQGGTLCGLRRLDEARRHARDLAPAVAELLAEQGWRPRAVHAVIVSRGPGSYTGLRVGIMSAKAFAYATGCALLAVDTFAAIAVQTPANIPRLDVIADAQQDKVYVQSFVRQPVGGGWAPLGPLAIRIFPEWLAGRDASAWVSGPGLHGKVDRLPNGTLIVDKAEWDARAVNLLHLGRPRYLAGEDDDLWAAEPLYLRPSAAEEKWQERVPK